MSDETQPLSEHTHSRQGEVVTVWDGTTKAFLFGELPPNCTSEVDGKFTNYTQSYVKTTYYDGNGSQDVILPVWQFSADPEVGYVDRSNAPLPSDTTVADLLRQKFIGWNPHINAPAPLNCSRVVQAQSMTPINFSLICEGNPDPIGDTIGSTSTGDASEGWATAGKALAGVAGAGFAILGLVGIRHCLSNRRQHRQVEDPGAEMTNLGSANGAAEVAQRFYDVEKVHI